MTSITPTIGRIVWFYPVAQAENYMVRLSEQPMAASVCHVNPDGSVNLLVTDHDGRSWSIHEVPLVQAGEEPPPDQSYCSWMPYQIGQAKKTEEAGAPSSGSATAP